MATAQTINVTSLDFDGIKAGLREYLSTQDEFTDYDWEASNLSILLDVLAYNTTYNAAMVNFYANEAFLDTAALRKNVLSHAKALGYKPRGTLAARARINFTIDSLTLSQGQVAPPTFVIPRGSTFSTMIGNQVYSFSTMTEYSAPLSGGKYYFTNIELAEGVFFAQEFLVTDVDHNPRYLLANPKVDASTVTMIIKESRTSNTLETWLPADRLVGLDDTSRAFFIQESSDNRYELYFGNGVVGKKPEVGNILHVEYMSTNGVAGNGAAVFSPLSAISHEGRGLQTVATYTITTTQRSTMGADPEEVEEIRLNASSTFIAQDRAVTADDYKTLIRNFFANIRNIRVWGGEYNDPPQYGRVYVSIQPQYGEILTEAEKDIIRDYIHNKSVADMQLEFVDSEYLNIIINTTAYYDPTRVRVGDDLNAQILTTISNYNDQYLNTFDAVFRHSKFSSLIDKTNKAILSNITTVQISRSFYPELGKNRSYSLKYLNPIISQDGQIASTPFTVFGVNFPVTLTNVGSKLYLVYTNEYGRTIFVEEVGSVDFGRGIVSISGITITSYTGSSGITITVAPLSNDVLSSAQIVARIPQTNVTLKLLAEQPGRTRIMTAS
jgi:hypothetical protein